MLLNVISKKTIEDFKAIDFKNLIMYNNVGDFNGNNKTAKRTISGIENARSANRLDKKRNAANENSQATTSSDEILGNNEG